jgi:hypothetical protein
VFLDFYVRRLLPGGAAFAARVKGALDIALAEKTHPGTRLLIRRYTEKRMVTLMELVRNIHRKSALAPNRRGPHPLSHEP